MLGLRRGENGSSWRTDHQLWIEAFAVFNFGGLAADIFLAHSQNRFGRPRRARQTPRRLPLRQPGATLFERILSGAPPMVPLLFPNLVALGLIGLWVLAPHVRQDAGVVEGGRRDGGEQRPGAG